MARGVKAGAWNVNRRQCCAAAHIVHKKHTLHKKTYFAQIAHQVAHKSNIAHTLPQTTQWIFYTHNIAHTADTLKWLNPPLHGKHRAHHPTSKTHKKCTPFTWTLHVAQSTLPGCCTVETVVEGRRPPPLYALTRTPSRTIVIVPILAKTIIMTIYV